MKFKTWLEYFEKNQIRGEYWIADGHVMQADDNSDYNHEGYVMMYMQSDIASHFGVESHSEYLDWDKIKKQIVDEILQDASPEEYEALAEKADDDPDGFIALQMDDPEANEKMQIANGYGDARLYAIMKWGWKRVAGNDIESRALTSDDMRQIASGLYDIDPDLSDDAEFNISVYGNKSYTVTLAELEAGKLNTDVENQGFEQRQRQQQTANDIATRNAAMQVADLDKQQMNPYYQNKKFPFADWRLF
jgi:hypothetical protein